MSISPKLLVPVLPILFVSMPLLAGEPLEPGATPWRYIGVGHQQMDGCPPPPDGSGWRVEPLFEPSDNIALARFCLYERDDDGNPEPLHGLSLERIDPDVMGVSGHGSALADATWKALEHQFLAQAGQVALSGAAGPVRLAVIDASPTGIANGASGPEDLNASSPHGTALLNMARDLLCDADETSCRATVTSRLAMSWECLDARDPTRCRNLTQGGYVGLIGELAQAVQAEVAAWRHAAGPSRLVINLSLGWHQSLGGTQANVADMIAPAQAVYRAIEDAVCRGALPIAAAGNRDAAASPDSGPFLPALWETRPAPDGADCKALGLPTRPLPSAAPRYRPLVFSVAGVEASGAPIDLTRQGGIARLAAFADHAVVTFSDTTQPTGTLTGSSVAALVVSTAAAAAWSYDPTSSAFQVMATVYESGTPLGRSADYCLGGNRCPRRWSGVRQVTVCGAVVETCGVTGCTPPSCATADPLDLSDAGLDDLDASSPIDLALLDDELPASPLCGGETVFFDGGGPPPEDPCPHRQYDGPHLSPWTEPQPDSIPCPNCVGTFASPGTLYFEVDAEWRGPLTSATLRCGATSYALSRGPLVAGDQLRLINVPTICLTSAPVFLSFTHREGRAVLSPLLTCDGCR